MEGHGRFSPAYDAGHIIKNCGPTKTSRRLPDGSEKHVGGGTVLAIYVHAFANRDITIWFAKTTLKQYYLMKEHYFGMPHLETQDKVLGAASPAQSPVDVTDAITTDEVVSAVLDVDADWYLCGVLVVNEAN